MKKIEWTKEEISDLCSYLRSNIEEESWGSIYIDALETRIRDEDMRQWYPDFYVFLPYVSVGLAWALAPAYRALGKTGRAVQTVALILVCAILVYTAAYGYRQTTSGDLALQRAWAEEAVARYGGERVVSIGVPEALVLLHRANPNPYIFVINGIDNRIEANTPGGFEGWLDQLAAYDPDVVFYGSTRGRFAPRLEEWLEKRYRRATIGEWTLYVRPERAG